MPTCASPLMIAGVTGARDSTSSGCCFANPFTYSRHLAPMSFSKFQKNFAVVVCRDGSGILILPFHLGFRRSSRLLGVSSAFNNSLLYRMLIGKMRQGVISASFPLHCSGNFSVEGARSRVHLRA